PTPRRRKLCIREHAGYKAFFLTGACYFEVRLLRGRQVSAIPGVARPIPGERIRQENAVLPKPLRGPVLDIEDIRRPVRPDALEARLAHAARQNIARHDGPQITAVIGAVRATTAIDVSEGVIPASVIQRKRRTRLLEDGDPDGADTVGTARSAGSDGLRGVAEGDLTGLLAVELEPLTVPRFRRRYDEATHPVRVCCLVAQDMPPIDPQDALDTASRGVFDLD